VARDLTRFQSALYAVEAKVAGLDRLIADLEDAARQEAPDKAARIGALRQAFRRVDSALARIN
jgi:citrate lyase beta subunit